MNYLILFDGTSAAIVGGGTLVATVLRSGLHDCGTTLRALGHIVRPSFDAARVHSELSLQIQDIHRDGLLRAPVHHVGDADFDDSTDALLETRSVGALLAAHEIHKHQRQAASDRAVRTLAQAAELAPVFGLAGTLISLSQLPAQGLGASSFTGSIAMAVITTLYGLLGANLVLAPLARIVERKAAAEEADRQLVIDWIAAQVAAPGAPRAVRSVAAR